MLEPLALYIHWPYCLSKCPYCDFNSHVAKTVDHAQWAQAYIHEINYYKNLLGARNITSIFFGGGTPSLMAPATVDRVIETAQRAWRFANDIEITLEANPTSVEATKFSAFATAGVNRVSLGVQALNEPDLRNLGRLHSVQEALDALKIAQKQFDRVSFDLIYARQHQTVGAWEDELRRALEIGTNHLSLYQLTIEPGTAFGDRYKMGKLKGLPTDDLGAEMYAVTNALCEEAGLAGYEISNHSRPGEESKHNLIYWQYGDYVGVGPGAFGRISLGDEKFETSNERAPTKWLDDARSSTGAARWTPLTRRERAIEYAMMGLRLSRGISLTRLNQMDNDLLDLSAVRAMQKQGLLETTDDLLRTTDRGRPLLNAILLEILG